MLRLEKRSLMDGIITKKIWDIAMMASSGFRYLERGAQEKYGVQQSK